MNITVYEGVKSKRMFKINYIAHASKVTDGYFTITDETGYIWGVSELMLFDMILNGVQQVLGKDDEF